MSQEIFPASDESFAPFRTILDISAVVGTDNLAAKRAANERAYLTGSGDESLTERQSVFQTDVMITPKNIVSSTEALRDSSVKHRGRNTLVTIDDHASSMVANINYFSDPVNFDIAAASLEKATPDQTVGSALPYEFHWLVSPQILKSNDFELALKEFTKNGNQCIQEARLMRDKINSDNLRFQMAMEEITVMENGEEIKKSKRTNQIQTFTLELYPQDIFQIFSDDGLLAKNIQSVAKQELLNKISIIDTQLQILERLRLSKNISDEQKPSKLNGYLSNLERRLNSLDFTGFSESFRKMVDQQAKKEGVEFGEYLAENPTMDFVLGILDKGSEQGQEARVLIERIRSNPQAFLNPTKAVTSTSEKTA